MLSSRRHRHTSRCCFTFFSPPSSSLPSLRVNLRNSTSQPTTSTDVRRSWRSVCWHTHTSCRSFVCDHCVSFCPFDSPFHHVCVITGSRLDLNSSPCLRRHHFFVTASLCYSRTFGPCPGQTVCKVHLLLRVSWHKHTSSPGFRELVVL